jgi:quinohemoprotein ethanol dehydrogenase
METGCRWGIVSRLAAGSLLLASIPALGQDAGAFSAAQLVRPADINWSTNGGSLDNQRYSTLTQLNKTNVANLKGVWHVNLGSGAGPQFSGEAQPLVYNGVAYIPTGADDVFAIDVATGGIKWKYEANLPAAMNTVCCGWTSRGVGLSDKYVFVGQLDNQLKALDRNTGKVVWSTPAEKWQDGFSITAAPLYYDGLVIVGFAGGEIGIRGRIKAFDAETGRVVWTFYTIPGSGQPGSDTWPKDNALWLHGGAPIWNTPAVDPELGLLYFSTGNAAADSNGSHRAGDNLFTASILALDIKTGKYRWHFQEVHHDIWDYDAANPVMLFDLAIKGVQHKALAQAGKTGWFYILDRVTGRPLIGIDEKPVMQEPRQATAKTQPHPRGDAFIPQSMRIAPEGFTMVNEARIFTPYWTEATPISPSVAGGANWPPSAYDPRAGHTFVCATDSPFVTKAVDIGSEPPKPGERYSAGVLLGPAMYRFGVIAAMDMRTNRIVWQQHLPDPCYSGITVTAGGLLFVGRNDGRLTALDSANGKKLWEFPTGSGMNAPVTTFSHQGNQYILAYAAGSALGGTKHGDDLWLFGLDGKIEPSAKPAGGTAAPLPVNMASGEPNLVAGRQLYESVCIACHGADGKSGHGGADLSVSKLDVQKIAETVANGGKTMPAFASVFKPEPLRDVVGYVSKSIVKK